MPTTDALKRYREKRDFNITPEPQDDAQARAGRDTGADTLSFVIQKHWASHLHYDFRLELDGSMKSWAVPKGPSLDNKVKRMAMEVEDHPIAYNQFEGEIPAKQYGAGTVIIWDRGTWTPIGDPQQGYRDGNLKFSLDGEKLQGKFALIRMKGDGDTDGKRKPAWLLIKEKDAFTRPEAEFIVTEELPDSVVRSKPSKKTGKTAKQAAATTDVSTPATSKSTGKKAAAAAAGAATGASSSAASANTLASTPVKPAGKTASVTKSPRRRSSAKAGALPIPEGAVPAALPEALVPQLATLVSQAPTDGDDWLYEIKFDGYRLLARIDGDAVSLITRNGNDWSAKMPHLVKAIAALKLPSGWLDGEIIVMNSVGLPDFQALQNAFDGAATQAIAYYVFDLPHYAGHDLTQVPLRARRALLAQLLAQDTEGPVRFSQAFDLPPGELLESSCRLGLEGVIGKRADAPYVSRRSPDWIKIKCHMRQEFVIGGYTDPKGARGGFGSLLLGVHDAEGKLQYAGNVGTGFNEHMLEDLHRKLVAAQADKTPFAGKTGLERGAHWVKPTMLAEVAFAGWTGGDRLRHAVFHGLRTDKPAVNIIRERPVDVDADGSASLGEIAPAEGNAKAAPKAARKTAEKVAAKTATKMATKVAAKVATKAATKTTSSAATAAPATALPAPGRSPTTRPAATLPATLRLTHPDKVIDSASGSRKRDVATYYAEVAPLIMPHLAHRPTALVRAPDGVGGQLFFQKHAESAAMAGIDLLDPALDPGHAPLLNVARPEGLLSAAQMNVLEFHTWNARDDAIAKPDRMTFDLDPGEGMAWPLVQESAQLVRAFLTELGLTSFLKTSGGKGLHVVVPLKRQHGWEAIKDFSHAIVDHLAATIPQRFVAKSGPANRVGKLFVDYLRNGFGATTACAWSLRSRPGLGISVPVAWEELAQLHSGAHWTIANIGERLAVGNTPWDAYASSACSLSAAMKKLGFTPPKGG